MYRGARVVSSPRTVPSAVCRGPPRSAKELPLSPRTLLGTQATDWGLCNRVIFPALDLIRSHLILLLVGAHNSGRGAAIQPPIMINYDFQKFTKEIYTNLNGHSHKKLLTWIFARKFDFPKNIPRGQTSSRRRRTEAQRPFPLPQRSRECARSTGECFWENRFFDQKS